MQGESVRNADSADSRSRVLRLLAYALLVAAAVWTVLVFAGVISPRLFLYITLGLIIWVLILPHFTSVNPEIHARADRVGSRVQVSKGRWAGREATRPA
jgi:hypothetical protein